MMYYPIMDHVRHDMRYLLITSMVALIALQFSYDSLFLCLGAAAKDYNPVYKTCSPSGAWIDLSFFYTTTTTTTTSITPIFSMLWKPTTTHKATRQDVPFMHMCHSMHSPSSLNWKVELAQM